MTRDPFTAEEHKARCMMLGEFFRYRISLGYYMDFDARHMAYPARYDVITLEPVSPEEKQRRIEELEASGRKRYYE